MRTVRLGSGAGYAGDRIEPALELAERGEIDYLVFECLAERTIALAQQAKLRDPEGGYDPLLDARMRAVLPACRARGIRIVTNMGAANPIAAARRTGALARTLGLPACESPPSRGTTSSMRSVRATSPWRRAASRSPPSATASSRPTPISAPPRSSKPWRRGPTW